jgi:hypothetical protein
MEERNGSGLGTIIVDGRIRGPDRCRPRKKGMDKLSGGAMDFISQAGRVKMDVPASVGNGLYQGQW